MAMPVRVRREVMGIGRGRAKVANRVARTGIGHIGQKVVIRAGLAPTRCMTADRTGIALAKVVRRIRQRVSRAAMAHQRAIRREMPERKVAIATGDVGKWIAGRKSPNDSTSGASVLMTCGWHRAWRAPNARRSPAATELRNPLRGIVDLQPKVVPAP